MSDIDLERFAKVRDDHDQALAEIRAGTKRRTGCGTCSRKRPASAPATARSTSGNSRGDVHGR